MIICVGSIFLDRINKIENFPKKPIKLLSTKLEIRLGGSAAVASFTSKKLGIKTEFIGRFGNDKTAVFLKKEFRKKNINISKSITIKKSITSQSNVIEDKKGERLLVAYNDQSILKSKKIPKLYFRKKNVYLIDTRWIRAAKYITKNTKKNNIKCVADLDNFKLNKEIEFVVKNVSYPIFSEIGLKEYKKNKSIKNALKEIYFERKKFVGVTLGAKGVYWINNDIFFHCSIPKIKTVETNCAGDVFHGAFAVSVSLNKSIEDSILFASSAATLKCMKHGGIYSIPDLKSVLQFTKKISIKKYKIRY